MVSRSYVVMGERGVIFLFSAKRPPPSERRVVQLPAPGRPAALLSAYLLGNFLLGPAFTSFRQSLPTEKSLPVRPKLRIIQAARTRYPRNKNIDVLVSCHREDASLYGHRLGRKVLPPPPH